MEIAQNLVGFLLFCGVVYLIYTRAPSFKEKVDSFFGKFKK